MLRKTNRSLFLLVFFVSFVLFSVNEYAEGADWIPMSSLSGIWEVHSGTGTARLGGTVYQLKMLPSGGSLEIKDIQGDESSAVTTMDYTCPWGVYLNGAYQGTEIISSNGPSPFKWTRTGDNTFTTIIGGDWVVKASFTSENSGIIEETGPYYMYGTSVNVNAKYRITKKTGDGNGGGGGGDGGGGGGCDTGIGFGLVLVLGALALFKKEKHKV